MAWVRNSLEGLVFLGLLDSSLKMNSKQSILVTLVAHMEKLMTMKSDD